MNEFIEKLIGRLEESKKVLEEESLKELIINGHTLDFENYNGGVGAVKCIITLVNHLAEEHKSNVMINEQYCWNTCGATEHCKECNRLCNGSIDYYENYDFMAEEYNGGWMEELLEAKKNCSEDSDCSKCPFGQIEDRCILAELQIEGGNNGWIPCSERLPNLFDTVIVTTKDGETWFGHWDGQGFEDDGTEYFHTLKVIAWQPLPVPYNPKGE